MTFEDFEFGPETVGIMMAMADDIASGNANEVFDAGDCTDPTDNEISDSEPETKSSFNRNRPFERFVDDVLKGRKDIHDAPDTGYDYYQEPKPFSHGYGQLLLMPGGMTVFRHHLISPKFLALVKKITGLHGHDGVRSIIFTQDGYPRQNQRPIFSIYSRHSEAIIINLKKHFENAVAISVNVHLGYSVRALYWYSLIHCFLHELHHGKLLRDDDYTAESKRAEVEEQAETWAEQAFSALVVQMDAEPPVINEDTFFCRLFNEAMRGQKESGNEKWVSHQKRLVDADLMYWDEETGIAVPTMKALFGIL